jgi:hypothetical protein
MEVLLGEKVGIRWRVFPPNDFLRYGNCLLIAIRGCTQWSQNMTSQSECPNCEKLWQRLKEQEEKTEKKAKEIGSYQTTLIVLIVLSAINVVLNLIRS